MKRNRKYAELAARAVRRGAPTRRDRSNDYAALKAAHLDRSGEEYRRQLKSAGGEEQ